MSRRWQYRPGKRDTTIRVVLDEFMGTDEETANTYLNEAQPVNHSATFTERAQATSSAVTSKVGVGTIFTEEVEEWVGPDASRQANLTQGGEDNFVTYGTSHHDSRGTSLQQFQFYDTFLNKPPAYRKFFKTTLGTTSNTDISLALARPWIKYLSISWKGGAEHPTYSALRVWTTAEVNAFFASLPPADHRVYQLTWWHEPASDWDNSTAQAAEFRSRQRDLADLIHSKGRSDVLFGPILNGFTFDYAPSNNKHWTTYWPGNGGYCDFMGVDQYSRSTPTEGTVNNPGSGYETAAAMVDPLHTAWQTTDAPFWSIHEMASRLSPGDSGDSPDRINLVIPDPTGITRSQYYQSWIDKLDSLNGACRVVYYWEAALWKDGVYKDYRLDAETGTYSQTVWKNACTASRARLGL